MSRPLTIQGTTFNYPSDKENPGWGEDASDWAEAITNAVNDLSSSTDPPLTTAIIADNVAAPANVTGALFLTPGVKSFNVSYVINRSDGATSSNESGFLLGVYTGTDWLMSRDYVGESSVGLTITSTGQIQYTSSSIGGVYTGTITFKTTGGVL